MKKTVIAAGTVGCEGGSAVVDTGGVAVQQMAVRAAVCGANSMDCVGSVNGIVVCVAAVRGVGVSGNV